MVVDSSAVVAILLREPLWEPLLEQLESDPAPKIAAGTLVESAIVLITRLGVPGKTLLARFIYESGLEVVPITSEHWPVAADAFLKYGKGRHPAALNFGDCVTYAVSRVADEPLLCLGYDFPLTDLSLVELSPG